MMSSGAATATGTPNPVMPWMKLEKPQPMMSACASPVACQSGHAAPDGVDGLQPVEHVVQVYTEVHTMVSTNSDRLMPLAAAMAA